MLNVFINGYSKIKAISAYHGIGLFRGNEDMVFVIKVPVLVQEKEEQVINLTEWRTPSLVQIYLFPKHQNLRAYVNLPDLIRQQVKYIYNPNVRF